MLTVIRKRFFFRGTIQGVGFRPAIYRLAASLGLLGFVQNRRSEVVAEVQGLEEAVSRFAVLLSGVPPSCRARRIGHRRRRSIRARTKTGFGSLKARRTCSRFLPFLPTCLCARNVRASCWIQPTAATSTPSSPARSAARATRSWRELPLTGRTPRCGHSRSAPRARASTRTPRTGGSTPRRTRALCGPRLSCT